ncbi:MAG: hypothetical protein JXR97_00125 [Planctomycetes bacterium]|nr:hypothetical protein [Planctomycetota bacterium]
MRKLFIMLFLAFAANCVAYASESIDLIEEDKPNGSFRLGLGEEFKGATGSLIEDTEAPKSKRPALKLHGDFTGGGSYVQAGRSIPKEDIDEITFYAKSDTGDEFGVRYIDGGSQCHQLGYRFKKRGSWEKFTFDPGKFSKRKEGTLPPGAIEYKHWGGKEDGVWDGPWGNGIYFILGGATCGGTKKGDLCISSVVLKNKSSTHLTTVSLDEELEKGELKWGFTRGEEFGGAQGNIEVVKDQPKKKDYAVKMNGDFTAAGTYVAATRKVEFKEDYEIKYITFKLCSKTADSYNLRIGDSTGQTHQGPHFKLKSDGEWHDVTVRVDSLIKGEHWGGDNDGSLHRPIKSLSILIGKGGGNVKDLMISDLKAVIYKAPKSKK